MKNYSTLLLKHRFLSCLALGLLFLGRAETVNAQYQRFAFTNEGSDARIISTSGALAVYDLKLTVRTDGVIRASGIRYNVASNGVSPSPLLGTRVSNALTPVSRLGSPLAVRTNISTSTVSYWDGKGERQAILTNKTIESSCYGALYLNDSMKAKGIIASLVETFDFLDYSSWPYKIATVTNRAVFWDWPATYVARVLNNDPKLGMVTETGFGSFTGSAD